MLRYIYGHDLHKHPELAHSMFTDRADQFRTRLGWEVNVDANGEERDQYDALDPLYVIWEMPDGSHGGSMRFLPTTGRVMVNEIFGHLTGDCPVVSPLIWECTRFCLSRNAPSKVAGALMLGGGELMRNFGVRHFVGVFDKRMIRIYRAIGSSPEVLGSEGEGRDQISVGLWEFTPESYEVVAKRAGIAPELSRLWFDRAFGESGPVTPMAMTG
ncbi:acyl-homoserine-lactone synthase [Phaeobacter sp. QD34_3]|uniref:acyl-homoserine-lactone synthase n=1 Tax=unclassified Phaeobacter TaxID=2621772 RepID=UPI00237F5A88|nr:MULTISPECIES: acyl-homoserine-lactone synthase [unclassified Phaeobacter]MDE4132868.1 acyl-homoserine-lactone synthase [Phaeobacter sp. QD34_3]MDE4136339.1 acyl-homoserine-lactone synthase [Phaeobacter sp. QD34_24]MDE4174737.1 acyl-homoserine-lactone synthase [Phaeobacter sp. PT47_59]